MLKESINIEHRKPFTIQGDSANIIISDFRREVGEIPDVLSFSREFLKRYPSDNQAEVLTAVFGEKGGDWSTSFFDFVMLIGQRGGKNTVAETLVDYAIFFISCLRNPHEFFTKKTKKLVPYTADKNFDIVNVSSVSSTQAQRAFFDTIKNVIKLTIDPKTKNNWFERYAGLDLRSGVGDIQTDNIVFPPRKQGEGSIRLLSFNSTAKAPEGLHILLYLADELSRAETKATYREAEKLLNLGMRNTGVSFPNGVGKTICWSYPNDSIYDLTYKKYEGSRNLEGVYARKFKTWEFNPSVTKEMFDRFYRADPLNAMLCFECIKPLARNNYFAPYPEKLEEAINNELENRIKYKLTHIERETTRGKRKQTAIEILEIKGDSRERCFAIDPSRVKDRFVIVGGYNETIDPLQLEVIRGDSEEIIFLNKKPVIDIIIVIDPQQGYPIDYTSIGDVLSQLIKHFPNTQSVNSDHFQNAKLLDEITKKGISANTYHFANATQVRLYDKLKIQLFNNCVEICNDKFHKVQDGSEYITNTSLWLKEGQQLIKEGQKIDHPNGGSKDLTDCTAIAVYDLLELDAKSGSVDSVEFLSDEKLLDLCDLYMEEKYKLKQQGLEDETQINGLLCVNLRISEVELRKLANLVSERYGY